MLYDIKALGGKHCRGCLLSGLDLHPLMQRLRTQEAVVCVKCSKQAAEASLPQSILR